MKRVVITGIGTVSSVGTGVHTFWDSLLAREYKFAKVTSFDTSSLGSRNAAEVKTLDLSTLPRRKGASSGTRSAQFGLAAANLALQHAGIDPASLDLGRVGVAYGAGCPLRTLAEFHDRTVLEGPRYADPGLFPNAAMSAAACLISILFGFRAFNATFSSGETASMDALVYAANMLKAGHAELVLAGGVYELSYQEYASFNHYRMLASAEDGGEEVCRPFDGQRNGFILGEGSAVLVVEELDSAVRANRVPIAEISGFGGSFDPLPRPGYDCWGRGARLAMQSALRSAGRDPGQVDVVFANANGGRAADAMESRALHRVFSQHQMPRITAIKSSLAETHSAAGVFQTAAAALAIRRSTIPPTLHFKEPGIASRIIPVTETLHAVRVRTAMVNAFGKMGNNASIVLTAA